MENILKIENIVSIEDRLAKSIDLLEIAKTYCEFNCAKSDEISTLFSILELILEQQRETINHMDALLAG